MLLSFIHEFDCTLENVDRLVLSTDSNSDDKKRGYMYCYKNELIYTVNSNCSYNVLTSLKKYYPEDCPKIVNIAYHPDLNCLVIALTNGDIMSVDLCSVSGEYAGCILDICAAADDTECVGCINGGLTAMEWSPDAENVAFLSAENTVTVMSSSFEILHEVNLIEEEAGEQEMINVGWGRKETQFHGSEGKQAALKKSEPGNVTENVDDHKSYITWRGDSSLFAISYWCPKRECRQIKIFSRGGVLQYVAETIPGLEGPMSWRPTGNVIALSQQLPNKHVICFMEKNGLRHGDFTLPENIKVRELSWSTDSNILSMVCTDLKTQNSWDKECVLLWTCNNYHWYLKQWLHFPSPVISLCWDHNAANAAHILLVDGALHYYQWTWTVDHSLGVADNDLATVAVIDGYNVLMTSFKKASVPPPMAGTTVTLPRPVNQIMFSPYSGLSDSESSFDIECNPNSCAAVLSNGKVALVSPTGAFSMLNIDIQELNLWKSVSHWVWLAPKTFMCYSTVSTVHIVCTLHLEGDTVNLEETPCTLPVLTMNKVVGSANEVVIQLKDGTIFEMANSRNYGINNNVLPEPCAAVWATNEALYTLSSHNRMFVNGEEIANNVTSFVVHPPYLIMTLTTNTLRAVRTDRSFKAILSENDSTRRLERGSRIVIAMENSIVLQLPRGNLETIQPRALTILTAARHLDNGEYKQLAELLRRQRIDLNLCVDHNPITFLLSINRFVQRIHDPAWFSLFLAELNDQDVTRGIYASCYDQSKRPVQLEDKVSRVCKALREAMIQSDEGLAYYMNPVLSSYVKVGNIAQAIELASTDKDLSYLALLVDTDKLYEEALGAYNLEKALKIAGKSQKDPKEYVAYLNELREMEPAYMKFTIDKRLHKPESAVKHLALCEGEEKFDEILAYVKTNGVYVLAMNLYKNNEKQYSIIAAAYGDHLMTLKKYDEAGIMYARSGSLEKAVDAFLKAGDWQQCVIIAKKLNYGDDLYKKLLTVLKSRREYRCAAEVCRELLNDLEEAVASLVEGRLWSEALYLCQSQSCEHLIGSHIKPALLEFANYLMAELKSQKELLERHSNRLLQVRKEKEEKLNRVSNLDFDPVSDIQSDTGSVSSFNTSSTSGSRSSKNTRKMKRKMWSLKEGNPREEQALLSAISSLIQTVYGFTDEIHSTCLVLLRFDADDLGNSLQNAMEATLIFAEKVKNRVWPSHKTVEDSQAALDAQLDIPPVVPATSQWQLDIFSANQKLH